MVILRAFALVMALMGCAGPSAVTATSQNSSPQHNSAAPDASSTQARLIAGYELTLQERDEACFVAYSGHQHSGELHTSLIPPCHFVMAPQGEDVQQVVYADLGNGTVIILVGTPGEGEAFEVAPPAWCGTQSQAVILRDVGVLLSQRVASGRKCNTGEDEKEFWLFAH